MAVYAKPKTSIAHLSHSAVSKYAECGEKFRLSRVYGLDTDTWWTTIMGTAVHYVTEQYDRASAGVHLLTDETRPEDFHAVFQREVDKQERLGVEIKASGKITKSICKSGSPTKKDRAWCEKYGPEYIASWIAWRRSKNFKIAFLPDGLGIEYKINSSLGGVPFVGYIDRVFETPDGELLVVDLKTGMVSPDVQLKTYAALLRLQGVDVSRASFWKAVEGEETPWVNTPASGDAGVAALVSRAAHGIEAGVFVPNVSHYCGSCSVADYCVAQGGKHAGDVSEILPLTIGVPSVDEDGVLL